MAKAAFFCALSKAFKRLTYPSVRDINCRLTPEDTGHKNIGGNMEFLKDVLGEDLYKQVYDKLNGNKEKRICHYL